MGKCGGRVLKGCGWGEGDLIEIGMAQDFTTHPHLTVPRRILISPHTLTPHPHPAPHTFGPHSHPAVISHCFQLPPFPPLQTRIAAAGALDSLTTLLYHSDPRVLLNAVTALWSLCNEQGSLAASAAPAIAPLVGLLGIPDALVRLSFLPTLSLTYP